MLQVVTPHEMRDLDRHLVERMGIPSVVLMENAARGALRVIEDWIEAAPVAQPSVLLLCGTGNNGGDGIALARMLHERGVHCVDISIVGDPARFSPGARTQWEILSHIRGGDATNNPLEDIVQRPHSIVIDAILGTGARFPLDPDAIEAVLALNAHAHEHSAKVLALDIPTGLDGLTGEVAEQRGKPLAVRANRTVTMGARKIGFYQGNARAYTGEITCVPLGAPLPLKEIEFESRYLLLEEHDIAPMFPIRSDVASKFHLGRILGICGSRGMTGAAIMAARAILRSGCGFANIVVPKSERSLVAQAMPELLTVGCAETEEGNPSVDGWDELQPHFERSDVVLIGSGLRPGARTSELLLRTIAEIDKPMVIDGGAIGALVGNLGLLRKRTSPTIITPHSGELSRLTGIEWSELEKQRLAQAVQFAREHNVIVVAKGSPTYTVGKDAYINSSGNSGMATAGSGDVLAGILAGTLGQMRERPLEAAIFSVYLHGLAGDLAANQITRVAMTASDIIEYMPAAYRKLGIR